MKGAYRIFLTVAAVAMLAWSAQATLVTFQVDMSAQESLGNFVPAEDIIVVRGTFNGWAGNTAQCVLVGAIYAVDVEIPEGAIAYKFVNVRPGGDVWETLDADRAADIAGATQVLPVVYFSNVEPTFPVDVQVNFRVDMHVQELTGNFNPATDWVVVRGDHDSLNNWGGARRLTSETGNPSAGPGGA